MTVACEISFTFGGLAVDQTPQMNGTGMVIPGLHRTGEMIGGLLYGN